MIRPHTSSKVLLVADRRDGAVAAEGGATPVRRYRLARLRFEGRSAAPGSQFEHLKARL